MVILWKDSYQKGSTSYHHEGKNEELKATEDTEVCPLWQKNILPDNGWILILGNHFLH
jgi:hypothetical protein